MGNIDNLNSSLAESQYPSALPPFHFPFSPPFLARRGEEHLGIIKKYTILPIARNAPPSRSRVVSTKEKEKK